jgi:hypothetical protein
MNTQTQLTLAFDPPSALLVPPHLLPALEELLYWRIPGNTSLLAHDLDNDEARTWFSSACTAYPSLYKLTTVTYGYANIVSYLSRHKAIPLTAKEAGL